MSVLKEFKDFAMRGNVMDMAVGVIIGGAFGKIVGSLVTDILMPPIGYMLGGSAIGALSGLVGSSLSSTCIILASIVSFWLFVAEKNLPFEKNA